MLCKVGRTHEIKIKNTEETIKRGLSNYLKQQSCLKQLESTRRAFKKFGSISNKI